MARSGRLEGFKEVSKSLNDMSRAAARGVGRRSLKIPAEMLAREVRQNAAVLTGALYESVDVVAAKSQKGAPRIAVLASDIASVQEEFGNSKELATPFFRPAIDQGQDRRFKAFADALTIETNDSVIRAAKAAAKG
ncbi:MAG: hypothetical protein ACSLE1_02960 [Sphingobium sp.]